jgi:hypothetical protein
VSCEEARQLRVEPSHSGVVSDKDPGGGFLLIGRPRCGRCVNCHIMVERTAVASGRRDSRVVFLPDSARRKWRAFYKSKGTRVLLNLISNGI